MINNTTAEKQYPINTDLDTVYPITFQGAVPEGGVPEGGTPYLKVILQTPNELPQELTYNMHYTIVPNNAVGTTATIGVKLLTEEVAVSGGTLVITRDTPFKQEIDFQVGRIDPNQVEQAADLSVLRDQELRKDISYLAQVPDDHEERITAIEVKIPEEASSTNKLADKNYVNAHTNRTDNPHSVTKAQVGLGNCDNTSDLDKPVSTATQTALDGKVNKNADITGATHTKITYDSKGLVTGGSDITLSDVTDVTATAAEVNVLDGITASTAELNIMDGVTATTAEINHLSGVTSAVQTQLDGKVDENAAITGATKCKITYDSKGLVTAGDDISTSDLTDVSITTPTTGEVLTYDSTLQKWKNTASSATVGWGGISGTLSDQTDLQNALNGKANDNSVVHLTDNETIAGEKEFNGVIKTAYIKGLDGKEIIQLYHTATATAIDKWVTSPDGNTQALLAVQAFNDGTRVVSASNSHISGTGTVVTTADISKASDGYVKLGNGVIIQWKHVYWSGNSMGAVTLPTAFTSAQSFKAIAGWANDGYGTFWSESAYPVTIANQTSSSVTLNVYTGLDHNRYINIIAIGY